MIESRVGEGAAAVVYRARDGERVAAVKVLRASWRDDPVQRARLAREAALLEGWSHAHRVSVLDHGVLDDGRPYVAMEYVDAPTLRDVLRVRGGSRRWRRGR
ncbi:MAG: protein kinase [Polyangiales bacterium]